MTDKDKTDHSGAKNPAPDLGRVQERQEEQRQQDLGRDTKPGGRNDDPSKANR